MELQNELPHKKAARKLPVRQTKMLIVRNAQHDLLLYKRPPTGIWGGLWSFPECAVDSDVINWCESEIGIQISSIDELPAIRHTFSHFHLDITPVLLATGSAPDRMKSQAQQAPIRVMDSADYVWYNNNEHHKLGFAAPVSRLIAQLNK